MDEDITTKNPEAKLYADPKELKSEPKFEESIGQRIKLRKQSSNKFTEYKNNVNNELNELFKKHLKCQSPSNKYKALNETKSEERKKIQVNLNKSGLANLKKLIICLKMM